jgi:hypothetical protein
MKGMKGVPEAAKGKTVHAQLPITETVHLMASDAIPGFGPFTPRDLMGRTLS